MSAVFMMILLPIAGAAITLTLRSRPIALKATATLVAGATMVTCLLGTTPPASLSTALALLFTVTALVSIVGQQPLRTSAGSASMILLLLGQSLGVLFTGPPGSRLLIATIMGTMALAVWRTTGRADSLRAGALLSLGVGIVALLWSAAGPGTMAAVWLMVVAATLLPLFPLHGGFVGSVATLSGTLPAFLAVILPCLGWQLLAATVEAVPAGLREGLPAIAIVSGLFGLLRAATQVHLARALASATASLLATVWWYLGTTGTAAAAGWYVLTVGLTSSGLLLGAHVLDARYGVRDVEKLGGLARTMPRFATLIGLLFMAAMGLPLFGVFSGFMTMLFVPSLPKVSLLLVLVVWLVASLLLLKLWHRAFYGPPRNDLLYEDLTLAEVLPFGVIVGLLLIAAAVPAQLVGPDSRGGIVASMTHTP